MKTNMQMKTRNWLAAACGAVALFAACTSGDNRPSDQDDSTYMDAPMEMAPPVDTLSQDTLLQDSL